MDDVAGFGLAEDNRAFICGGEYRAKDPELIKLAELAHSYRDNIKSILGFWIPDNSSPAWILGVFLGKMGLETASRKKGSAGQQVKFYSLTVESMVFAAQVLEYRHQQRVKREERKRQREEENRLHQMMLETQYGITDNSISTPVENKDISSKQERVDMAKTQFSGVLDRIESGISLLETINLWLEMIKSSIGEVSLTNWIRKLLVNQLKIFN